LIESAEVEAPDGPPQLWADDGLVDEHFPSICQRFGGAVRAISLDGALHGEFAA
jgi:hypothetical protein